MPVPTSWGARASWSWRPCPKARCASASNSVGRTLCIPGAALVGDAAHTVHPVGGQGMNLAFQDAELLADLLGHAQGRADLLDEATRLYSDGRRRQVKRVLHLTHVMGLIGSLESLPLIRAREMFLRLFNRTRLLKKLFVQRIIDVG